MTFCKKNILKINYPKILSQIFNHDNYQNQNLSSTNFQE